MPPDPTELTGGRDRSTPAAGGEDAGDGIPEVLFVCVHNAGRSQIAAAILEHRSHGRVRVRSAGSRPADRLDPGVVEAMAEWGLDISHEDPKPLTGDAVRAADVVVTMGCGDACPYHPGKRYLDWDLPDPAGQPLDQVRAIRDEINDRVRTLLAELLPPDSPGPARR
jgi:arsenate reductase (thioredoxin)